MRLPAIKPLKSYFFSQEKCPIVLKTFFEDECAEAWLCFVNNQASRFHSIILKVESEKVCMVEVAQTLECFKLNLIARRNEPYIPIEVLKILKYLENEGQIDITKYKKKAISFYTTCIEYMDQWTPYYNEILILKWTLLETTPEWPEIQKSYEFILDKKSDIILNESELFDEMSCVKAFVSKERIDAWKIKETAVDQKWVEIFSHFDDKNISYNNVFKIIEFCICLPGSNAPVERVFSIMANIWTKEKSQLSIETLRSLLITRCNYEMNCLEFFEYIEKKTLLLKKIHSVEKYK